MHCQKTLIDVKIYIFFGLKAIPNFLKICSYLNNLLSRPAGSLTLVTPQMFSLEDGIASQQHEICVTLADSGCRSNLFCAELMKVQVQPSSEQVV